MAVVQLSMADICRTCLSKENLKTLAIERLETVQEIVDIQISLNDGLPSKICTDCWDQVAKWKLCKEKFKKKFWQTDSTLRVLLQLSEPSGSQAPADEPTDLALTEKVMVSENEKDRREQSDLMKSVNESNFSVDGERKEAGQETTQAEPQPQRQQPTPSAPVTKTGQVHICKVCRRGFARAQTLQSHMLTHTDEKPFKCDICPKRFKCQAYLKNHLVTHSRIPFQYPEQNFLNSVLELKFSTPNVHMDVERMLKGPVYAQGFMNSSYLEAHKNFHSKDRKFKCPEAECLKSYNSLATLNRHKNTVHTPEVYKCQHCQELFRLKHSYEDHLKSHV